MPLFKQKMFLNWNSVFWNDGCRLEVSKLFYNLLFKPFNLSEYFTQDRSTLTKEIREIYARTPYELELVTY